MRSAGQYFPSLPPFRAVLPSPRSLTRNFSHDVTLFLLHTTPPHSSPQYFPSLPPFRAILPSPASSTRNFSDDVITFLLHTTFWLSSAQYFPVVQLAKANTAPG